VQLVSDIRGIPRSRANPRYDLLTLSIERARDGIDHLRIAEIGGLRKKSEVPPGMNAFWTNDSFHSYAEYALSESFARDDVAVRYAKRAFPDSEFDSFVDALAGRVTSFDKHEIV
jgi:hypothetical protein